VVALATLKIVQEQVQVGGDVGKALIANADRIEVDLEKITLMIKRQEM
jgi:hypothetical protein